MRQGTAVGLDVHARSAWAATLDCVTGELCSRRVPATCEGIVEWARGLAGPVSVGYEAGPTGFGLARALEAAGIACVVAAPSKLERAPGDRVKTDRRDAELLARRVRSSEVVAVRVPTEDEEAARDLVRAREDARGDLMRARHRLSKLLLRHGLVYDGNAWTREHERWLAQLHFERRGLQLAFDEAQAAVFAVAARRERLDRAISEMAAEPAWRDCVGRLCCLRGVGVLTAFALSVEIGDWRRFNGATIGSYLGLVPSEDSSGQRRSQGAITKTGNMHARRLLVEAAWHHRRPYRPSRELIRRREGQPAAVRERAERANRRLHQRWVAFDARNKRSTISCVAVARELAGWSWSLAIMDT